MHLKMITVRLHSFKQNATHTTLIHSVTMQVNCPSKLSKVVSKHSYDSTPQDIPLSLAGLKTHLTVKHEKLFSYNTKKTKCNQDLAETANSQALDMRLLFSTSRCVKTAKTPTYVYCFQWIRTAIVCYRYIIWHLIKTLTCITRKTCKIWRKTLTLTVFRHISFIPT
jgi:hypothetical protein